jgi:hypothetical protein
MTYKEQLKTPEWEAKRKKILKRDNYTCQGCCSKNNLQVHHKIYFPNLMAWQYENNYLITYCEQCHDEWHCLKYEINKLIARINFREGHFHTIFDILKMSVNTYEEKLHEIYCVVEAVKKCKINYEIDND